MSTPRQSLMTQYLVPKSTSKEQVSLDESLGKDDLKPDFGARMKGVAIAKPIVYGNVARVLPEHERRPNDHTHKWTVFVKPYLNEDFSVFIKKIHFKLHDSFSDCNRVVTKPPFEIEETGWGEFEIAIRIYFQDPNEKQIVLYHQLKLFHNPENRKAIEENLPVYCEKYEEIVFQDPSVGLHGLLEKSSSYPYVSGEWKHQTDFEKEKETTIALLKEAKKVIRAEIEEKKAELIRVRANISKFLKVVAKSRKATPATSYLAKVSEIFRLK